MVDEVLFIWEGEGCDCDWNVVDCFFDFYYFYVVGAYGWDKVVCNDEVVYFLERRSSEGSFVSAYDFVFFRRAYKVHDSVDLKVKDLFVVFVKGEPQSLHPKKR